MVLPVGGPLAPTVAQVPLALAAESDDGAGLAGLGMKGAVLACIGGFDSARTGGAGDVTLFDSDENIVVVIGLVFGRSCDRKMFGNVTTGKPS